MNNIDEFLYSDFNNHSMNELSPSTWEGKYMYVCI